MPSIHSFSVPSYRLHKASGQAVVTLSGRDVYLGAHGSPESRAAYERAIAEWLVSGRRDPQTSADTCTVTELLAAFYDFAQGYYVRDGQSTSSLLSFRRVIRDLRPLYGATLVADFSPKSLKAFMERLVGQGLSRPTVNDYAALVKAIFRWGVTEGIVPGSVWHGLLAVPGLKVGRTQAWEPAPVRPVADSVVEATLPHLGRVVADMVRVHRLTGARPGEICSMSTGQIDTTGKVWMYRPAAHKTGYLGKERVIAIGPQAQSILRKYLRTELDRPLFSPIEAEAERREKSHADRVAPLCCGNRPGSNRKRRPKKAPGDSYDTAGYARAIARACERALSTYSVERHSTSKPVNHMAHTMATRNGCCGSLNAVSTSTRLPSGVSKPVLSR